MNLGLVKNDIYGVLTSCIYIFQLIFNSLSSLSYFFESFQIWIRLWSFGRVHEEKCMKITIFLWRNRTEQHDGWFWTEQPLNCSRYLRKPQYYFEIALVSLSFFFSQPLVTFIYLLFLFLFIFWAGFQREKKTLELFICCNVIPCIERSISFSP